MGLYNSGLVSNSELGGFGNSFLIDSQVCLTSIGIERGVPRSGFCREAQRSDSDVSSAGAEAEGRFLRGPPELGPRLRSAGDKKSWDVGSGSFAYDSTGRIMGSPPPHDLSSVLYGPQNLSEAALSGEVGTTYRYSAEGQRYWEREGGGAGGVLIRAGSFHD